MTSESKNIFLTQSPWLHKFCSLSIISPTFNPHLVQDCRKGSPNAILSFKIAVNSQKNQSCDVFKWSRQKKRA